MTNSGPGSTRPMPGWRLQVAAASAVKRARARLSGSAAARLDGGYISAKETVKAAEDRGMSVRDYVEELWDQRGATERVLDKMAELGCLRQGATVCEIGPGTGRYMDLIIKLTDPDRVDFYETAEDWAEWLAATYAPPAVRRAADGKSLAETAASSCHLTHAHGVFVYLPPLRSFDYFAEMARVTAPGGYIVFDVYSEAQFDPDTVDRWMQSRDRYPMVLPRQTVVTFFERRGFRLVGEFTNKHGQGESLYLVFSRLADGAAGPRGRSMRL